MTKRGKKSKQSRDAATPAEAKPTPATSVTVPRRLSEVHDPDAKAPVPAAMNSGAADEGGDEPVTDARRRSDRLLVGSAALVAGLLALIQVGSAVEGTAIWRRLAGGKLLAAGTWPTEDPFVFTRPGAGWDNLSWLFDLGVYGLYAAGGAPLAVTVKALAVVWAAWLLSTLRLKNATSMWPVLATLCVLTASGRTFTLAPVAFGFVALAVIVWLLERHRQGAAGWTLGGLIPLAAVWANVDARAGIGVILVGAYWLALWLSAFLSNSDTQPSEAATAHDPSGAAATGSVRTLGLVWLGMIAASFATPTFAASWTGFLQHLIGPGETAMAVFGEVGTWSLYQAASWPAGGVTPESLWREWLLAALTLVSLATFALPQPRFPWERLGLLLPALFWAPVAMDNIPLAGLVVASVASLNLQSTTMFGRPAIWSIIGRSIATVGLLAVAVLGMTGRLRGSGEYDFGVDFSPHALDDLEDVQAFFARLPPEALGFYMLPSHGNLAAWATPGRKSYLDTRWEAFSQPTLTEYQQVRMAIRDGDDPVWQAVFDREKLDFVLVHVPALAPTATYDRLLGRRGWMLTHLGSETAAFFRADCQLPNALSFLRQERFEGTDLAFHVRGPLLETTPEPLAGPDWLRDQLWRMESGPPPATFSEGFNLWRTGGSPVYSPDRRLPYVLLSINRLRQAILERPQYRPAYFTLAQAYERLIQIESQITGTPINEMHDMRRSQLLAALNAAQRADPQNMMVELGLVRWELQANLIDLAGEHLQRARRLRAAWQGEFPPEIDAQLEGLPKAEKFETHIAETRAAVEKAKTAGKSPAEQARLALERSCPGLAMELLGDESRLLPLDAPGFMILVNTALACGEPGLARRTINRYEQALQAELDPEQLAWMHGWLELLEGNYRGALSFWETTIHEVTMRQGAALIDGSRRLLDGQLEPIVSAMAQSYGDPISLADRQILSTLVMLEAHQPAAARERLRMALGGMDRHPLGPLMAFYWERLTDEPLSMSLADEPPGWEPRPLPLGKK